MVKFMWFSSVWGKCVKTRYGQAPCPYDSFAFRHKKDINQHKHSKMKKFIHG